MDPGAHTPNTADWKRWIRLTATAGASLESLPATPCEDWCDLAASRFSTLPGVLGAIVMLARGDQYQLTNLDAVGVHAQPPTPERPSLDDSEMLRVRSWLENTPPAKLFSLDSMGLRAESGGVTPHKAWNRVGNSDRKIVVQLVTSPRTESSPVPLTATLDALTPLLARRATIAMGAGGGPPTWLTSREKLVLDNLIQGSSVREIAELIERSPHTVHDHVKNLHRKLGASSRGALVARALGHTALPDHEPLIQSQGRAAPATPGPGHHVEPKSPAPARAERL